jgi:RND family efflux transporter MFP subunit
MDSQHLQSPDLTKEPGKQKHRSGIGRISLIILSASGVVVALLTLGILPRLNQQAELQTTLKAKSTVPSVNVVTAQHAPAQTNLVLPGSVVPLNQTIIYARTDGYLQRWLVDIGARVQQGQLIAVIASPDVDQQVNQTRAQLAQTQANLVESRANLAQGQSNLILAHANEVLAAKTWVRWRDLLQQGVVSQEDADTRLASYKVNVANVKAAQNIISSDQAKVNAAQAAVNSASANLQRYQVLQSFEQVRAPFTGIITTRNANTGDLITAGSSKNNTSLYTITAYNPLEVNVNVPQSDAPSLQLGQTAQIQVRQFPRRVFTGKVIRTTNAIDPSSRTLLTQLSVQNPSELLLPGMYADVKFNITSVNPPLMVPDSALVINSKGTLLATVTKDQTVHYQEVQLGRDNGKTVEILSGLEPNVSIIANPTANLVEGTPVQVVAANK